MSQQFIPIKEQIFGCLLLPLLVGTVPYSPCPRIFAYERVSKSTPSQDHQFWKGIITIPHFLPSYKDSVRLKVVLAVPTTIPSKYVGRMDFRGDREKLVEGRETSLRYEVTFPSIAPVPFLLQIRINGRFLCNAPLPQAPVVTKIILEHSLYPHRIALANRLGDVNDFDENLFGSGESCGEYSALNPLVVNGETVPLGAYPWLVPVFRKTNRGLLFHCSGSLVSDSFIISAAHCFENVSSKDIIAYVGRQNIQDWTDSESQPRSVDSIVIHPDFNASTLYTDIAILKLARPVEWTARVAPACLWGGPSSLDLVVGKNATVIGWGIDKIGEKDISATPKAAVIPIVNQETCLRSRRDFLYFSSNRTLCAGARNGTGPCNGDSGGGLYLPMKSASGDTRWYLRGIISLTLQDPITRQCDLLNYAVFTDVAKFQSWIKSIMEPSGT